MDANRFDRLARLFSATSGRRGVVRGALALMVGRTALGAEPAAATQPPVEPWLPPMPHPRCRPGGHACGRDAQCCSGSCPVGRGVPIQNRNRCACAEGLVRANGRCVDLATDERHCGAIGHRCAAGQTCCWGVCRNLLTDDDNCGACDVFCGENRTCCSGICRSPLSDVLHCGGCGQACGDEQACCDAQCTDIDRDGLNCGACGVACDGDSEICADYRCQDITSDVANCGAIGNACLAGYACCSGVCRDLRTDDVSCGACGVVCDNNLDQFCQNGACGGPD